MGSGFPYCAQLGTTVEGVIAERNQRMPSMNLTGGVPKGVLSPGKTVITKKR